MNDQSNACMCEMMLKGSKEALTVLIDTYVTHVERVERLCYVETRNKHIFEVCQRGQKSK